MGVSNIGSRIVFGAGVSSFVVDMCDGLVCGNPAGEKPSANPRRQHVRRGLVRALHLWLPIDTGSPGEARRQVRRWLTCRGWPEQETSDLLLVVSEAVSNAVEHAYLAPSGENQRVELRVTDQAWPERDAPSGRPGDRPGSVVGAPSRSGTSGSGPSADACAYRFSFGEHWRGWDHGEDGQPCRSIGPARGE
jgi:hypothetical protein